MQGNVTKRQYLFATLLILLIGQAALSAILPGTIQLTRYENGQPIRWTTTGTSALIHGDDADLFIAYDKTTRQWVCILQANDATSATDGRVPQLKACFGGSGVSNAMHLEARIVN